MDLVYTPVAKKTVTPIMMVKRGKITAKTMNMFLHSR